MAPDPAGQWVAMSQEPTWEGHQGQSPVTPITSSPLHTRPSHQVPELGSSWTNTQHKMKLPSSWGGGRSCPGLPAPEIRRVSGLSPGRLPLLLGAGSDTPTQELAGREGEEGEEGRIQFSFRFLY